MNTLKDITVYLQAPQDCDISWQDDGTTWIIDYHALAWGLNLSREEYKAKEKAIQDVNIQTDDYDIYAWCDVSGYDYWTIQQEEDNYIIVTIIIKNISKDWTPEELDAISYQVNEIIINLI